jgi:2-oxoglutarate ferredoxin oxidoreductase subunit beta
MDQLKQLVLGGIAHKGFAFIDILQVCATFFNMTDYYNTHSYDLSGHETGNFSAACERVREWDYNSEGRIALGLLYQRAFPLFEDRLITQPLQRPDRNAAISEFLSARQ